MNDFSDSQLMFFEPRSKTMSKSGLAGLPVAVQEGHEVNSYVELLEKIAALNYHNSRFRLLFRGQTGDYRLTIKGERGERSNLYPSILRATPNISRADLLDRRFEFLKRAEELLVSDIKPDLKIDDVRLRIVRWAILQHYEVCKTPLLDVTLSLQSALSFACDCDTENNIKNLDGFLFVLAIPYLSGPISISVESMTQAIDLCQICPPDALRPHFQAGILLGDYPEYLDRRQTDDERGFLKNDFCCRLLTKFHLRNIRQWNEQGFIPTPRDLLFPDRRDRWYQTLLAIKHKLQEGYSVV